MSASFSHPEMTSFDPQNPHTSSQAPSIVSLRIPQQSVPQTAATSMLTVCPPEDEKEYEGTSGPSGDREETGEAREASMAPEIPQVALTFLLVSGNRRTMSFDPETTVGRVKELVWNAWPSDWQDEKPPAPNFLRILYLGKILQDEDNLNNLSLPTLSSPVSPPSPTLTRAQSTTATIVHLSIRPYAPPPEDEALIKKNLRAARRALSRSASTAQARPTGALPVEEARAGSSCCGCIIC